MKAIRTLALAVAGLLLASGAFAQEWAGRARLQGQVVDDQGAPIVGARVKFLYKGAGPEAVVTDDKGEWKIGGLAGGDWVIRVEADGFVPAESDRRVASNDKGRVPITIPLRPVPPEVLGPSPLERLEKGNALLEAGQAAEARAEYEAAREMLAPESQPIVLLAIARTHYLEENLEQTEATLRQALEFDPESVDALKLLSNLLVGAGREQEAKEFMDRLPEGEKMPADAYLNVGIEFYNAGDLDRALAEFDGVVVSYPEDPNAYYYRGLVFLAQGENAKAADDFKKVLELEPEGERADEVKEFLKYL